MSSRSDLASALRLAEELPGEAFRACALARQLGGWTPETDTLLERERYGGRLIDAYEAVRALRRENEPRDWQEVFAEVPDTTGQTQLWLEAPASQPTLQDVERAARALADTTERR